MIAREDNVVRELTTSDFGSAVLVAILVATQPCFNLAN